MDIAVQENLFSENVFVFDQNNIDGLERFLKSIKGKRICFTGHRPNHLPWGHNEDCDLCEAFKTKLNFLLKECVDAGFETFISGVALGFDTIACEAVLSLKEKYSYIDLNLAIPCKNQSEKWGIEDKQRYNKLLESANPIYVSSDYFKGCYNKRNRFMVDSSDLVIACFNGQSGGTKSTLNYAMKKQKNIIILKP